jgi:hypothetical protein
MFTVSSAPGFGRQPPEKVPSSPQVPVNVESSGPCVTLMVTSLSVGTPVGLGVYLAWVNRDWSAMTKITGLAAAVGGGLIGARLGFNVTDAGFGLFAPLLAIVGAIVGANLTVLALDVAWDWQARDRFAVTEALEARPSPG